MKALIIIMMVSVSTCFFIGSGSIVQAEPLKTFKALTDLECRNPHSHQDIGKTPIIRNSTDRWLPKGTQILWTASDGDKGTIVLTKALSPHAQDDNEVQGVGETGKIYTCKAQAVLKLQIKEEELEIKSVKIKEGWNHGGLCLTETTKLIVHVVNNGGGPAYFKIRTPHPTSQIHSYNINANQETKFEVYGKSSGVIKNDHVSIPTYLANPLTGNLLCEKYGYDDTTVQNQTAILTLFCDSDMTNQMVTITMPYGKGENISPVTPTSHLCSEQIPKTQSVPDSTISVIPSKDVPKPQYESESKISVISSRDVQNIVIIKFNNNNLKRSNKHVVEIKSPRNAQVIWSGSMSFPSGVKIFKLKHKSLDLKNQPIGRMAYHVLINQKKVGIVFIKNEGQRQKSGKRMGKPDQEDIKATRTAAKPLKPKLHISLSLKNTNLKVGKKATIMISVKNIGKGTLNKSESYSLQCSSKCPFNMGEMKFNVNLEPGNTRSFRLISNALTAGDYDIIVKTKFGSSKKMKFNVKPDKRIQSKPSENRRSDPATTR